MKKWLGFLALSALLLSGCSAANFQDYTALGDLRVLTIIVNPPETNPGGTVIFTPVLSDLNGKGRALSFATQACMDPGVGVGVTPACPVPDAGSQQSGTVTPAAGSSQTYTGAVATFTMTMPSATEAFAGRSAADQYNGVNYLVFYSVSVPNGGPSVSSFVRVALSTKSPQNQNPMITSIDLNDVPTTSPFAMPTVTSNFRVTSPASSAETYQVMRPDGTFYTQTEELINTWFLSDGSFDVYRTLGNSENAWSLPSPKPVGRGMVILAVTRDGRGGAAFQKIEMY